MIARTAMDSRSECRGTVETCMIRVARELDCLRAHIRLRDPDKSEDKIELARSHSSDALKLYSCFRMVDRMISARITTFVSNTRQPFETLRVVQ
ncbi:hypothetical protein GW17_00046043 [Ensete ventricosum]|nr:hypothetical protein GW17_00046043 [Ensete ventricosum]